MHKKVQFNPDGNDLRKVMYYYGIELEEKIICPFHDDNHPSCHVNFDDGTFHCFACEAHGNAFKFVQMANPELNDLEHLLKYYQVLKSKKVVQAKFRLRKGKSKRQKRVDKAHELEMASDYYYGLKTIDWKKDRSVPRYYMIDRGYTTKTLNYIGAKLTYNDSYPFILPILDNGKFKGYVCRAIDKKIADKRKYLYNKGFSKIDTLGGDYTGKIVVLVEGYLDMLKLKQYGLKNVAAIFGWKITKPQIEKLRKVGVKTVISALDMDKPGRDGTDYLENFFDVVRFKFPKGTKDPGDMSKEQFDIAYAKTKRLIRSRRNHSVNSRQYQKRRSKQRIKQR